MNVRELLIAMTGFYKGFDAPAVTAGADVFKRKLERYEGDELANAWVEVAAEFKPTGMKPYPLPSDFHDVLPRAAKMPKGAGGPVLDRKGHAERKAKLVADWIEQERGEVARSYGPRVAFWCESEVRDRADTLAWKTGEDAPASISLADKDVLRIFESIVSRDRMDAFGGWPIGRLSAPLWEEQMQICRGHVLAGRYSRDNVAHPVETVPRKKGMVAPTVTLEPSEFSEVGPVPPWIDDGAPERDSVPE